MKRFGTFIAALLLLPLFVLIAYCASVLIYYSNPVLEIISGVRYSPRSSWILFDPKERTGFYYRVRQRFHAGMTRSDLVKRLSNEGFDVQKIFVSDRACYSEKCKKVEGVTYLITSYVEGSGSTWSIYWETGDQDDRVLYVDAEASVFIH
jgi:hypothetical protein